MIDAGIGFSQNKNALQAAEEAIRMARSSKKDKEKIDLAIVFTTADYSPSFISKLLSNSFEGTTIIGSTALGAMSSHGITKHGLALMLLSFDEGTYFSAGFTKDIRSKAVLDSGKELGEKLIYGFKNIARNLCLLFIDKLLDDNVSFIHGLQEHLGRSFPCIGGFSSTRHSAAKANIYFNTQVLTDSCASILLGGKVSFGLGTKHGWKPLGKPHTVTNSAGNFVKSIDARPAIELYEQYLSHKLSQLKKEINHLSVFYPIGLFIEGEDEYLLRNVVGIYEDGSIECEGDVPEKSTIRLMISTKETCLEATQQAAREALKALSSQTFRARKDSTSKVVIAFSSFSRYNLLKRDAKKELDIIKDVVGPNVPIIGMYTSGELSPLKSTSYKGQIYFHKQAISILILEG